MEKSSIIVILTDRKMLTLDADVAEIIRQKLAQNPQLTENRVINDYIRKGIQSETLTLLKPFKIKPFKTRFAAGTQTLLDEL